ncbi:hypothetical protein [Gorillibacterium sp. sgz5001074]|uniref:hypothetical protein n=1 Tax=Gorillibacterium sp. sgz5001074 TaxID=3446695 RepID=UPI003F678266
MYTALAIFASVIGLLVTGAAVYTAWFVWKLRQEKKDPLDGNSFVASALLKWTVFDFGLVFLVLAGLVFLLADLVGVMKDKDLYPYYHYGYLISGFIFCLLGLLFLLTRLFLVLRLAGKGAAAPHHHHEPNQAHQADGGV